MIAHQAGRKLNHASTQRNSILIHKDDPIVVGGGDNDYRPMTADPIDILPSPSPHDP
jgi:hypothetical protein